MLFLSKECDWVGLAEEPPCTVQAITEGSMLGRRPPLAESLGRDGPAVKIANQPTSAGRCVSGGRSLFSTSFSFLFRCHSGPFSRSLDKIKRILVSSYCMVKVVHVSSRVLYLNGIREAIEPICPNFILLNPVQIAWCHAYTASSLDALWPGIGRARARALRRALSECVTWIKCRPSPTPDGMVRPKTRKSGIHKPWKSSYMSQC